MISVLIVCQRIDDNLMRTIQSVEDLHPQILVDISSRNEPLGVRKNRLIQMAAYDWVLVLDTDEYASPKLIDEIRRIVLNDKSMYAYKIPYMNIVFGSYIKHGGESYAKTRLFKKSKGLISELPVHEEIEVSGPLGILNGVIHHYSYVSLPQVLKKFTKYAWQMAGEMQKKNERVTFKKLFMYGPHMVWARAVKDEGWKDGWRGIVIALCFGYMETLMYWFLLWKNFIHR